MNVNQHAKFAGYLTNTDMEEYIMEKKSKFTALVSGAGKTAKDLLDKSKNLTIQVMDQNDDGKFDLADVSVMAESVGNAVKRGTQAIMDSAEKKARELELKTLRPIFTESLDDAEFLMPKFIRVADRDKKHAESEVCRGSIGYLSDQKGLHIVNIFRDSIEVFGLTFFPDSDSEFYYVDPTDRDVYIALDNYFSHLKIVRINELQKLAQDLGAKHFRVTYKEEQSSFTEHKMKAHTDAKINMVAKETTDGEHFAVEKKYSTVEIAAEMEFPGHAPIKPQLKYMQRDSSIQTLVAMRMDETAPLMHQRFMLKMSNSSGMKESDAIKIDAVLKDMKFSGNTTVASEAKNESRRYLEYEIDF